MSPRLAIAVGLLQAIVALRGGGNSGPALARKPAAEETRITGSAAERRQLSVMFCDLVGSTELSSRLDPEDLGQVIRAYQDRVRETMARFGGFIALYMGDGVLIYFGWPEAREAEAERAVRAALAVASAVGDTPIEGERLQVRIGVATGLVVVGEPIGIGDSRQQTVIGETPNRAARLQGLAGPNNVVIDAATRQQIGRIVRVPRPRCRPAEGPAGAGAGLERAGRECGGKPLRGTARDPAHTVDRS